MKVFMKNAAGDLVKVVSTAEQLSLSLPGYTDIDKKEYRALLWAKGKAAANRKKEEAAARLAKIKSGFLD